MTTEKEMAHRLSKEVMGLKEENAKLKTALKDLFKMIDDGELVRNTTRDHEPDWARRQMNFVMSLKFAKEAIDE